MTFSENKTNQYFFSQPHQPYFFLAFVNALVLMVLFLLSYKGIMTLTLNPVNLHAYGLTYLLFTPAFFGFLFTTFPRFAATQAIEKSVYLKLFISYALGSLLFIVGILFSELLLHLSVIVLFVAHLLGFFILKNIYTRTEVEDTFDLFWLTLTMGFGVIAHFIFILSIVLYLPISAISLEISSYLYLFLLTFSVAQRMIPFFSHCNIEKNKLLIKQLLILLIVRIGLDHVLPHSAFFVDLTIAYLVIKELRRWKLPFPNPNPMLWILHLSLFWIPMAFLLSGISNFISLTFGTVFLALDVHTLLLGFVLTALIGFGTRVTLGHSGNKMQADTWTKALFYGTQIVVLIRLLTSLVAGLGWNFMILFNVSAFAWILLFGLWGLHFFAVLTKGKKLTE